MPYRTRGHGQHRSVYHYENKVFAPRIPEPHKFTMGDKFIHERVRTPIEGARYRTIKRGKHEIVLENGQVQAILHPVEEWHRLCKHDRCPHEELRRKM